MKNLSRLSKECIANKGLCCEHRTPPFLLPSEIELLINNKKIEESFVFGKESAMPKSLCAFFNEPLCSVYEKRPVDCRTYPVSINMRLPHGKIFYVVDLKCPAVIKGLVPESFIKKAVGIWKENMPSEEWIAEYLQKDNKRNYSWMKIENYADYKRGLKKAATQNL